MSQLRRSARDRKQVLHDGFVSSDSIEARGDISRKRSNPQAQDRVTRTNKKGRSDSGASASSIPRSLPSTSTGTGIPTHEPVTVREGPHLKFNSSIMDRISRVRSQRMYMLSREDINDYYKRFMIIGSVGNVYTVDINNKPRCNCPDFSNGNVCKHIIFVYLKVLGVGPDDDILCQRSLLTSEIISLFASARPNPTALAPSRAVAAFKKLVEPTFISEEEETTTRPVEGPCAICYEDLVPSVHTCKTCGNHVHSECWGQWTGAGKSTCVHCRAEQTTTSISSVVINEGYINLASTASLSINRDTSSYYYNNWDLSSDGYMRYGGRRGGWKRRRGYY
jgi:hypothetical protein